MELSQKGYLFWHGKDKLDGQLEFAKCPCGNFGPTVKSGRRTLSKVVCFECGEERLPKRWDSRSKADKVRKHRHQSIDALDAALKKSNEIGNSNLELTFPI
jgi:hypothetical protein